MTIYRPQGTRLQGYIHARRGRVDATRIHNGNSTLRQSYTQKTAYRWWIMAYFSHSARTARAQRAHSARYAPNSSCLDSPCVATCVRCSRLTAQHTHNDELVTDLIGGASYLQKVPVDAPYWLIPFPLVLCCRCMPKLANMHVGRATTHTHSVR